MTFASPIWLLALLPWGALIVYMLLGRRPRVDVPFVRLWRGPLKVKRPRRGFEAPPIYVAVALLAMLVALLAAAGPVLKDGRPERPSVTIILDRGLTMSARGQARERYRELIEALTPELIAAFGSGPQNVIAIPADSSASTELDASALAAWVAKLAPTTADTRSAVYAAASDALAQGTGLVVVLTDQKLDVADERLLRVAPATPLRNAGITHLAARQEPTPQVMVRIGNESALTRAVLRVRVDGSPALETPIDLPAEGEREYFLDLPALGPTLAAELVIDDDLAADNFAYLARQRRWARIEVRSPIRPELQAMFDAYTRQRPADDASPRIAVVTSRDRLPGAGPAVAVVSPSAGAAASRPALADVSVARHAVTANLEQIASALGQVSLGPEPPEPASWTTLIAVGGRPALSVREAPARQAWVAFESDAFARSKEFVILWANLLDWVGGASGEEGAGAFAASTLDELDASWRPVGASTVERGPGLYTQYGQVRAFNLPPVAQPAGAEGDSREKLHALVRGHPRPPGGRAIGPVAIVAAVMLLALAGASWKRKPEA